MATLKWNMEDLLPIIKHSMGAKDRRVTYEALFNYGFESSEDMSQEDRMRVSEACLWLVKDHGIYLMSNGRPGLPDDEDEPEGRSKIVYAIGYDPRTGDVWDKCRDAVGGDDFSEEIGNRKFWMDAVDLAPDGELEIQVTATSLKIGLVRKQMAKVEDMGGGKRSGRDAERRFLGAPKI